MIRKLSRLIVLMCVSFCAFSSNSFDTGRFTIVNMSKFPMSFSIQNRCSANINTVNAYSTKSLKISQLIELCDRYDTCEIRGYAGSGCYGSSFGSMVISFRNNSMSIERLDDSLPILIAGSTGLQEYNFFIKDR